MNKWSNIKISSSKPRIDLAPTAKLEIDLAPTIKAQNQPRTSSQSLEPTWHQQSKPETNPTPTTKAQNWPDDAILPRKGIG